MSDELDGIRIRRLAAVRKAAFRARSHCIIAAIACVVLAAELVWTGIQRRSLASILVSLLAVIGMLWFWRKARKLHRETITSSLAEPAAPPDFSTLSDGSQQAKNLEEIHD